MARHSPGTDGLFVLALVHELLHRERVDLDFLLRYTNAPWLVLRNSGGADDGLFARDDERRILAWDRHGGGAVDPLLPEIQPQLFSEVTLADGRRAVPVLALLVERYLAPQYAPENVAERCGIAASVIRRIAAELAETAFERELVLDQPRTDWAGRRHEKMIGRPVSMHAMRGISTHSNGFHTCRAIHLLQMLLGVVDTPGSWRYKSPYPRPLTPAMKPTGQPHHVGRDSRCRARRWAFPQDPRICCSMRPQRIDKAFSWEAPLAIHGMLQTVIRSAWKGDPYPIDTLFLYMANMSWNSAMNTAGTIDMLTDRGTDGEYKIPRRSAVPMRISRRWWPMPIWCCRI